MRKIISIFLISAAFFIFTAFFHTDSINAVHCAAKSNNQSSCEADPTCEFRPAGLGGRAQCSDVPTGCAAIDDRNSCAATSGCEVVEQGAGQFDCSPIPTGCAAKGNNQSSCEADTTCKWRIIGTGIGQCTIRTSQDNSDEEAPGDVNELLRGLGKCGQINQQCCKKLEPFHIDLPHLPIPIIGTVLDVVVSPLEGILNIIVENTFIPLKNLLATSLFGADEGGDEFKCAQGKPAVQGNSCVCADDRIINLAKLCAPIKSDAERTQCLECHKDGKGIWTGLGCFYSDAPTFIQKTLLGFMVGLAGIVALLCIMYSAFILQTSRGNPERIKKAREYLTNCILGLIVIIFSIFLLRLIGVEILRIPFLQ